MRHRLDWIFACATLVAVTACRDGGTGVLPPRDLAGSPPADLTGVTPTDAGGDLSIPLTDGGNKDLTTVAATVNDINTGKVAPMTLVTVTGLVLIGQTINAGTSKAMRCQYSAFVQDPKGPAPSGIELFVSGGMCTPRDGGSCQCPFAPNSTTPLDDTMTLGDEFTVSGYVNVYVPSNADSGLLPAQHEISITKLTKTGSGKMVTPQVIADPKLFAKDGTGYQMYENMLVTIKPAKPAPVTKPNNFGEFTFAGANFGGAYRFVYGKADGGTFPDEPMVFSSITGIAIPAFSGKVSPRTAKDFVP